MSGERGSVEMPEAWLQIYRERKFGILLVLLVILLGGSPFLIGFGLPVIWFDGLLALVLLVSIYSLCFERRHRMFAVVLGFPTIIFCLGGHALSGSANFTVLLLGHVCGVLFFFGSAILIIRSLFSSRTLTLDSIFGAVCGYLFLGLAWAMAYSMIETFQPDSFHYTQPVDKGEHTSQPYTLLYYSFVTLTTLGYGDVVPISHTTRSLAWLEAVGGQFYVAIIVAGIVSMLVANKSQPVQASMDDQDDKSE